MNDSGLIQIPSRHSMKETRHLLESAFASHGLQVFARIDHTGEAEKVGLKMPPTQVLIFGSPKVGTLLMIAVLSLAIDLPWKALVGEDDQGRVWVTYNGAKYLKERHGVPRT